MFKNVATKIALFAFDTTTGVPKTGDAANITAYVSKDYGATTILTDTSATEQDATNAKGWYLFDVAQAETNADALLFTAKSSTANIVIVAQYVHTTPNRFTTLVIDAAGLADSNVVKLGPTGSGTAQTARDVGGNVDAAVSSRMATFTLPTNFSALSLNVSGQVDVIKVAGTTQTAGDIYALSVLIAGYIDTEIANIQSRLPSALVGGKMDSNLGSITAAIITAAAFAAGAIDANAIATDAIGSAELAASAVTEIQTGLATAAALATVQADTDDIQTRLPTALVGGRMDSSIGAIAAAIITNAAFAAGAIDSNAIATDAIGSAELASSAVDEILQKQLTESYNADGVAPTLTQAVMMILQILSEQVIVSGVGTVKKLDGTTTAATLTYNDPSAPTAVTRSA